MSVAKIARERFHSSAEQQPDQQDVLTRLYAHLEHELSLALNTKFGARTPNAGFSQRALQVETSDAVTKTTAEEDHINATSVVHFTLTLIFLSLSLSLSLSLTCAHVFDNTNDDFSWMQSELFVCQSCMGG